MSLIKQLDDTVNKFLGLNPLTAEDQKGLMRILDDANDSIRLLTKRLNEDSEHFLLTDSINDTRNRLNNENLELLQHVNQTMTVGQFLQGATEGFYLWPGLIIKKHPDRCVFAFGVETELFADNAIGWAAYCDWARQHVPWFDADPAGSNES